MNRSSTVACGEPDRGTDASRVHAPLRIAIMTDETGWHTGRLKKAFRARGAEARCVDLADCRIVDTTWQPHGLVLPGFSHTLPDAVFVRGIAGGTFEQVTLRLGILHALREVPADQPHGGAPRAAPATAVVAAPAAAPNNTRDDAPAAALNVFLTFLGAWPDSHILRKHGAAVAQSVTLAARAQHAQWRSALCEAGRAAARAPLDVWDAELKAAAINPGTSADLTVATLFVALCLDEPGNASGTERAPEA
ncbi:MAG: Possible glutaminyl transferase clustered with tetrahydromethanopterin biosynthesis genes [uncultured Paraburkholderia sp.]|nr:MAG: Possible glutaminyl transferase clustered with tetrahydromethanopterin biosynthesis genes [uncultured Paraburkholderia sp.]